MFSIITIASSTTNPVDIVSAISDRLSRLKPMRYMTISVPTRDRGTDRLGMIVAGRLRRNRKITRTTSATARPSSNSTSATEARIVVVRSVSTATFTAPGAGQADAGCLRDLLRQPRVAHILDLGQRQGRRGQRQGQDRCVGRIDL